jgi:hypothetical protein
VYRFVEVSMTDNAKLPVVSKSTLLGRDSIFGPAPILPEEDSAAYDGLLESVVADTKPTGAIDEIYVRDIIDLTWEILRGRRIKTDLIAQAAAAVLQAKLSRILSTTPDVTDVLGDLVPPLMSVQKLVQKWLRKDPAAVKRINKLLIKGNTTMAAIIAEATLAKLDVLERIDQLITTAEARRNLALRELDRHRFALAQALRDKINEIEDAEFRALDSTAPQIESGQNAT